MKLAEIYEILNEPRRALELVYEGARSSTHPSLSIWPVSVVIDSRKKRPTQKDGNNSESFPNASLFEEKSKGKGKASTGKAQSRLTPAQLRVLEEQKEAEVLIGYRRLTELWPCMLSEEEGQEDAEREWLFEAGKLVDMFRETRNLFLTSRVRLFAFRSLGNFILFYTESSVPRDVPKDARNQTDRRSSRGSSCVSSTFRSWLVSFPCKMSAAQSLCNYSSRQYRA